jgi:hypothetical protein
MTIISKVINPRILWGITLGMALCKSMPDERREHIHHTEYLPTQDTAKNLGHGGEANTFSATYSNVAIKERRELIEVSKQAWINLMATCAERLSVEQF